jgi:hypothetical protein
MPRLRGASGRDCWKFGDYRDVSCGRCGEFMVSGYATGLLATMSHESGCKHLVTTRSVAMADIAGPKLQVLRHHPRGRSFARTALTGVE